MNSKILVIGVAVVAIAAVVGISIVIAGNNDDSNDRPDSITDASGNVIDLTKDYEKVASTTAVGTEIMCDLEMKSKLVAVTNSSHIYEMTTHVSGIDLTLDYPSDIPDLIAAGTLTVLKYNWTAEQVAATNADLVIIDHNAVASDDSKMKQLQELGITCLVLYEENSWEKIGENYTMLGQVFDNKDRADDIIDAAEEADKMIMDKFEDQKSLKVAYICYCWGSYYIYNQSGLMDAALRLGCTNALPTETTTTITAEQVAAADIDVIFFDDMGTSLDWDAQIAAWQSDPVWGNIDAIKEGNFYCMEAQPFQATSYPTVHYVMGEGLTATMLYPDVVSVTLPNVITYENYAGYLSWMDA